jgi:protein-L-isoaspartate O-methyltransferase
MMKRRIVTAGFLGLLLLTTGCAALVVGTGAGVGVYSYIEGELRRTYPADFSPALEATEQALESLKIRVESKTSDGITTLFKTKRTDGTPVTVKVSRVSPRITEIGVRSGVVGLRDKNVSELIHATIAQRLI